MLCAAFFSGLHRTSAGPQHQGDASRQEPRGAGDGGAHVGGCHQGGAQPFACSGGVCCGGGVNVDGGGGVMVLVLMVLDDSLQTTRGIVALPRAVFFSSSCVVFCVCFFVNFLLFLSCFSMYVWTCYFFSFSSFPFFTWNLLLRRIMLTIIHVITGELRQCGSRGEGDGSCY